MKTPLRIWIAGMAAALLQPLIYAAAHAHYFLSVLEAPTVATVLAMQFAFAAVCVFVVGVPLFLLLRRTGRLGWAVVAIGGLAIGALPAWIGAGEGVLAAGLKGLAGALVFHAVWRRLGHVRPG
ncbi:hypothetical protein [Massilia aerilata]|uniref:Uncharacterized protein n=1 Tax=Massilia aerilata TaxID=453817 RepID=A0ABW0RWW1_9BURK